ncbi:outer membrane beta-barrel protein [Rhodohalobacter sp.]|uniref:outer membrane beta-barrel protein n=1 Tax=Rhodohalobacter sp. TaxID=1974210 RepID=UPI002ACDF728|nr:outer membrane beta-barrel protein [Rhodohalobacter sp.]MDZ7757728.1 outer membrane beta-barrel protein [Rhodohalobacter sp.]
MKTIKFILTLLLTLMYVQLSYAQGDASRFSFEIAGGPSHAKQTLGDADLNFGGGFEAVFHYRVMPHAGVYAGWGWNKFSADQSFAGSNADFEETGYVFGLQFKHPLGLGSTLGFLRAGGLYNHIEIENRDGDIIEDTGHGFGLQIAGGVEIPVSGKWSITPGVKFNSLSRDLDDDSSQIRELTLRYQSLRIGFHRKF